MQQITIYYTVELCSVHQYPYSRMVCRYSINTLDIYSLLSNGWEVGKAWIFFVLNFESDSDSN